MSAKSAIVKSHIIKTVQLIAGIFFGLPGIIGIIIGMTGDNTSEDITMGSIFLLLGCSGQLKW